MCRPAEGQGVDLSGDVVEDQRGLSLVEVPDDDRGEGPDGELPAVAPEGQGGDRRKRPDLERELHGACPAPIPSRPDGALASAGTTTSSERTIRRAGERVRPRASPESSPRRGRPRAVRRRRSSGATRARCGSVSGFSASGIRSSSSGSMSR